MHLSRNLHIHYVHLSQNLHIHYVQTSTSFQKMLVKSDFTSEQIKFDSWYKNVIHAQTKVCQNPFKWSAVSQNVGKFITLLSVNHSDDLLSIAFNKLTMYGSYIRE